MFAHERAACFELYNQTVFYNYVCEVLTDGRSVFIKDFDGVLLLNVNPGFPQAMCQRILVDFFQVAMPMVTMDGVRSFAHKITQFVYRVHGDGLSLGCLRNRAIFHEKQIKQH
jgi:hypothetical protein